MEHANRAQVGFELEKLDENGITLVEVRKLVKSFNANLWAISLIGKAVSYINRIGVRVLGGLPVAPSSHVKGIRDS